MARVGGAGKTSGKLIERSTYLSLTVMERKVVEQQAHTQPAASLPSAPRNLELPAARKSDLPLSRFPLRGKAGAGGFPPRRWHAVRQQKALAHSDAAAPPARGVSKRSAETPLAHPPSRHHRGRVQMISLDLRGRAGEKIEDGRHVGLDFYDLLIEARQPPSVRKHYTTYTRVIDKDVP
jgi:hypothetical protein